MPSHGIGAGRLAPDLEYDAGIITLSWYLVSDDNRIGFDSYIINISQTDIL